MCAEWLSGRQSGRASGRASGRRSGHGSVRQARLGGQGGQALVEVLVVAIALVPLAVLIVLLGKYQTMQSASIAASRSLAFECAVHPASCRAPDPSPLVDVVRARHFDGQPLWRDRAGRPLLEVAVIADDETLMARRVVARKELEPETEFEVELVFEY